MSRADKLMYATCGAVAGIVILTVVRFFAYAPDTTHYHANVAVFINGERETFNDPSYYAEVSACNVNGAQTPLERAHLHDNVNDLVHVHAKTVTWGNLFENLGWSIDTSYLRTRDVLYADNDTRTVNYMLNGKLIANPTRLVIGDRDRLLISYGTGSKADLQIQYAQVASSAAAADKAKDPQTCGGSQAISLSDRLRHALNVR